jgi:hypothetical protein
VSSYTKNNDIDNENADEEDYVDEEDNDRKRYILVQKKKKKAETPSQQAKKSVDKAMKKSNKKLKKDYKKIAKESGEHAVEVIKKAVKDEEKHAIQVTENAIKVDKMEIKEATNDAKVTNEESEQIVEDGAAKKMAFQTKKFKKIKKKNKKQTKKLQKLLKTFGEDNVKDYVPAELLEETQKFPNVLAQAGTIAKKIRNDMDTFSSTYVPELLQTAESDSSAVEGAQAHRCLKKCPCRFLSFWQLFQLAPVRWETFVSPQATLLERNL